MVYVDEARYPYGRMVMCHMMADTTEELLAMADAIGVARRWLQKPGRPDEHFDMCKTKRAAAVARGARPVSSRELVRLIRLRRPTSAPSAPSAPPAGDATPASGPAPAARGE